MSVLNQATNAAPAAIASSVSSTAQPHPVETFPAWELIDFKCSCFFERDIEYIYDLGLLGLFSKFVARCRICAAIKPEEGRIENARVTRAQVEQMRRERETRFNELKRQRDAKRSVTTKVKKANVTTALMKKEDNSHVTERNHAITDERFVVNLITRFYEFLGDHAVIASGTSRDWRDALVNYSPSWKMSIGAFCKFIFNSVKAFTFLPNNAYDAFHEEMFKRSVSGVKNYFNENKSLGLNYDWIGLKESLSQDSEEDSQTDDNDLPRYISPGERKQYEMLVRHRSPVIIDLITQRPHQRECVNRILRILAKTFRTIGMSDIFHQQFSHWLRYLDKFSNAKRAYLYNLLKP